MLKYSNNLKDLCSINPSEITLVIFCESDVDRSLLLLMYVVTVGSDTLDRTLVFATLGMDIFHLLLNVKEVSKQKRLNL